jgi:hypothetical protein
MTWRPTVSQAQAIKPRPATMNVNPTIRPGRECRRSPVIGNAATHEEGGTTDDTRLAKATTTEPTSPRTIGERMAGR